MNPQPDVPPGAESLVEFARADLGGRLGVDLTDITLVSFEAVVWPDASLGCPHPDMLYKQVPQDGSYIVLAYQGTTYEYHSGGGRDPFLCEQTLSRKDAGPQIDLGDFITPSPSIDQ